MSCLNHCNLFEAIVMIILYFYSLGSFFFGVRMSFVHAKPEFSHSQVTEIMKRLFDLTLSKIQPLPSYDDQNFHVVTDDGVEYVLKIMNSEDSKNFGLIDVQTYAMTFLHQNGLPTQTAVPTTSGQLLSLEEIGRNRLCRRSNMNLSL